MKKHALLAATIGLMAAPVFAAGPLGAVTGALNGLPVVGAALGGAPGSLPSLPTLPALPVIGSLPVLGTLPPSLPALNGTIGVVVEGKGVIVGLNTAAMPPVSVTTVGLPAILPALPGLPN